MSLLLLLIPLIEIGFVTIEENYGDLDDLAFSPLVQMVSYDNAKDNKKKAISENESKSGVYRWTHLDSNNLYVGSSVNLGIRFINYFNIIDSNIAKQINDNGYMKFNHRALHVGGFINHSMWFEW